MSVHDVKVQAMSVETTLIHGGITNLRNALDALVNVEGTEDACWSIAHAIETLEEYLDSRNTEHSVGNEDS